ncbi:MAG: hypothetical protein AAF682_11260 [Planctomycetota bacterium]
MTDEIQPAPRAAASPPQTAPRPAPEKGAPPRIAADAQLHARVDRFHLRLRDLDRDRDELNSTLTQLSSDVNELHGLRRALEREAGDSEDDASFSRLVAAATWRVEQEMGKRDEQRSRRWSMIATGAGLVAAAVLALVGWAVREGLKRTVDQAIADSRGALIADIASDVTSTVSAAFENRIDDTLEREQIYQGFRYQTLSLDLNTEFTATDRNEVLAALRIVAKDDRLRSRTGFRSALGQVLDSFIRASQDRAIDEIFSLYRTECLASSDIALPLLEHYAEQVIGYPDLVEMRPASMLQNFTLLADTDTVRRHLPGVLLAYKLMIDCRDSDGRSPRGDKLWEVALSLPANAEDPSSDSRATMLRVLLSMLHPRVLARKDTPEVLQMVAVADQLVAEYAKELSQLADALDDDYGVQFADSLVGATVASLTPEQLGSTSLEGYQATFQDVTAKLLGALHSTNGASSDQDEDEE